MSMPCTQFNPFGSQDKPLKALQMKIEKISKKFDEDTLKGQAVTAEATSFAKIMEELTEVLAKIPVHSIQTMISDIAGPLAKLIGHFGGINREEFNSVEFNNMFRRMSRFIQNVADLILEPFNSEVLCSCGDLFKALLTAKHNSFRENGALLWKKTFGTIKTPMKWPSDLRETLEKLPRRLGIHLPPVAKVSCDAPLLFTDDQAMDGLHIASNGASDFKKENQEELKDVSESQVTFQLSQQSTFNVMADKLLQDRSLKSETASTPKVTTKQTPTRKRTGKISMIDEDSCDYVPITATPPSSRRTRLTDRQKDTIEKAANPSTSINYVNEESQSGIQKSEKMKDAYKALNFEVGEDSMSALSENVERKSTQETKQDEKPVKRSLFDSPIRALPVVSSSAMSLGDVPKKEIEDCVMTSPPEKRPKTDNSPVLAIDSSKSEEQLEKLPNIIGETTVGKRRGRPSKTLKSAQEPTVTDNSSEKSSSVTPSDPIKECATKEVPKVSENSFCAAPIDDADSSKVAQSPPKTPRTPSILRAAKRIGGSDSPLTERKRNRVHFGEDSLPKDSLSSPMTPRRKAESKSPFKPPVANLDIKSNDILDIVSEADTKVTPFFPALTNCPDPIDKILLPLASMWTQKSKDCCKKELQRDGVTTIGKFASLPKSHIDKYSSIKTTKAFNVLVQYEKSWNSSKRVAESVNQKVAEKPEKIKITPTLATEVLSENLTVSSHTMQAPEQEKEGNILKKTDVLDLTNQSPAAVNTQKTSEVLCDSAVVALTTTTNEPVKATTESVVLSRETSPNEYVQRDAVIVEMKDKMEEDAKNVSLLATAVCLEDARNLRRVCYSLLNNENDWPAEKSVKLLNLVKTSSRCLKALIKDHGNGEWLNNDEDVENVASNIEEDSKKILELTNKLYRYKQMPGTPWLSIMSTLNESIMYLDTIYSERK